jgi:proline iminopeptidase
MQRQGLITIDGFPLAYRIEGEGQPVLVVGSALYYPRLFSSELPKAVQMVYLDHRGFSEATAPSPSSRDADAAGTTLQRVVRDIETMRDALGLDDVVVLGHSGHAFLAVEYALAYPEHVRGVVLLNTAPTNSPERQQQSFAFFEEAASPERKRRFAADMALLAGDLEREPERRFAHLCIRTGAQAFYDYTTDGASYWDGVRMTMPLIDHLWGEAFGQLNMLERLPLLDKPVFLGLGRHDYLVGPVSLWDAVAERCPHVSTRVFEQSGHNPMLEQAAEFDAALLAWLKRFALRGTPPLQGI